MRPEDHLKINIGDLVMQMSQLQSQVATLQELAGLPNSEQEREAMQKAHDAKQAEAADATEAAIAQINREAAERFAEEQNSAQER